MLAPLGIRLAWGIGVASLGIAFAAGMWLYGRCYVARMDLDETAGKLYVHTVRFFGNKKQAFDMSDVSVGEYHEGISELPDTPSVNAPWTTVKVSGRRLPLIVDEQGEFFRSDAAERLLGSAREARSVHD
jgi:TMEM70/TMEM186/TMEM223 protein family